MVKTKIVVVVPTVRPEQMKLFRTAWNELFCKYEVTLITVYDGDEPEVVVEHPATGQIEKPIHWAIVSDSWKQVVCRHTDAVRNLGFLVACSYKPDVVLTLDDDVVPVGDTINDHLNVLVRRVPTTWMNTAHQNAEYLRGVPYVCRSESGVVLSHGVWIGIPDFDAETQLRLEQTKGIPESLPYYVGPIPKYALFPLCGMNVAIRKQVLPYFYFAPMGPDSGVKCSICDGRGTTIDYDLEGNRCDELCGSCNGSGSPLNRFADIWMGISLKLEMDRHGHACYTGGSVVRHTRLSDATKNMEQERLVRKWNDDKEVRAFWRTGPPEFRPLPNPEGEEHKIMRLYFESYADKRWKFSQLIRSLMPGI